MPVSARHVFRAGLLATVAWYKNNKWMLFSMLIWPYMMVLIILTLGALYGSLSEYQKRLEVANPVLYILAGSAIAISSVGIIDAVAGFALWNRWVGTLPYIAMAPTSIWKLMVIGGLPESLITAAVTVLAILPGSVYLEGAAGCLKMVIVLGLIYLGMLPLLGLAALVGSLLLVIKEETHVTSSINPFFVLLSGVFYPIEILPRVMQAMAHAIPTKYVVEASRLMAAYHAPELKLLLAAFYALAAMSLAYNTLALAAVRGAESRVKRVGVG